MRREGADGGCLFLIKRAESSPGAFEPRHIDLRGSTCGALPRVQSCLHSADPVSMMDEALTTISDLRKEKIMEPDYLLREQLAELLSHSHAHSSFEESVAEYPMARINDHFPNGEYSAWGLLEHLRLAQWDILDFIRNPQYQERAWPQGYWPAPDQQATPDDWQRTIQAFQADQQALLEIIKDPYTDLWAPIPHGTGQTVAREIMVVADHNAYHIGEFAVMRQAMNTWGPSHR